MTPAVDFMGRTIVAGQTVVYPTRRGSQMWLNRAVRYASLGRPHHRLQREGSFVDHQELAERGGRSGHSPHRRVRHLHPRQRLSNP